MIEKLRPFKHLCMTVGNLPTSYLDSMSYYETLCWFCKFLKDQVIPAVNTNAEVVEELQKYIENYFDNLDVQEEINNKLDEMATDGTLAEIIAQYVLLQSVICYGTVAEMKLGTNMVSGSFVETLGFNTKGDSGASTYQIREVTNQDVIDEKNIIALNDPLLVAEYVPKFTIVPQQFGAKGDGTTDDSDIIKYSIEYASVKGMSVSLVGSYYINKKVEIKTGNSTVIYGSKSQIGTTVSGSDDNFANFILGNDGFFEINGVTNLTFENVGFNGTKKAIVLKSFRNRIINCGFNGFEVAISTESGTNWTGENVIDKCCFNSVITCIKLNYGSDGDITGNLADGTCTKFIESTNDAGYKIQNNHDYSQEGSSITGYNVTFVGNYVDGWNKLKITGNSGFTITGNTFIGIDPTSGTNCAITFTSQTISSGCITGNNVAKSNNFTPSDNLYFINLNGVNYFSNVTLSGNNTRVCKSIFVNNSSASVIGETNILENANIKYFEVNSRVHVTQFEGAINGNIVMCHTVATLTAGNTSDVVRLENICNKWLHILKMQNDNTVYTFFGDRSITLHGSWANAGGFEAWSFGIRDNQGSTQLTN